MSRVNWCGEPTCRCGPEGVDHPEARKVIDGDVNEIRQSDLLGEALARYKATGILFAGDHALVVAAARNWHTLTNPTDELIEASALWVSRIHSHNHAASVACIVCTETVRAALRAAVDALTEDS